MFIDVYISSSFVITYDRYKEDIHSLKIDFLMLYSQNEVVNIILFLLCLNLLLSLDFNHLLSTLINSCCVFPNFAHCNLLHCLLTYQLITTLHLDNYLLPLLPFRIISPCWYQNDKLLDSLLNHDKDLQKTNIIKYSENSVEICIL